MLFPLFMTYERQYILGDIMTKNFKEKINNYFLEFLRLNQLELFETIWDMIETRIEMLFPEMIKKYVPELEQKVNIEVQTSLNGQKSNLFESVREDCKRQLMKELQRGK